MTAKIIQFPKINFPWGTTIADMVLDAQLDIDEALRKHLDDIEFDPAGYVSRQPYTKFIERQNARKRFVIVK